MFISNSIWQNAKIQFVCELNMEQGLYETELNQMYLSTEFIWFILVLHDFMKILHTGHQQSLAN